MNDLTRQSSARKRNIIKKLMNQYAEIADHGRPRRCTPTGAEIAQGGFSSGDNGKAIFATEQSAQNFAAAVRHDIGGKPLRVYPCPRGHWHTTSSTMIQP